MEIHLFIMLMTAASISVTTAAAQSRGYKHLLQNLGRALAGLKYGDRNGLQFQQQVLLNSLLHHGADTNTIPVLLRRVKEIQTGTLDVNISDTCLNRTELYLEGLANGKTWALQMFDASAKLPSGILDGKITWLGSHSQCIRVKADVRYNVTHSDNTTTLTSDQFDGQYCLVSIPVPQLNGSFMGLTLDLNIGFCLPEGCNERDAVGLVNTVLSVIKLNTTGASGASCLQGDVPWSSGARAVMGIVGFLVLLVAMGTFYDIYHDQCSSCRSAEENSESPGNVHVYDCNISTSISARDDSASIDHLLRANEHTPLLNQRQDQSVNLKTAQTPCFTGKLHNVIVAFSLYTNGCKVLNTKQASGALTCVNGIRFLSMSWVIWGHTYLFLAMYTGNLLPFYTDIAERWTMQPLFVGSFSVDSFFVLSGLLVTYLTMKEMKKGTGRLRINWGLYYFHRYWRLTPPYMLVLLVYAVTFKYWNNGPMSTTNLFTRMEVCSETWWTNLLYVNNLVKSDKMCMGWSWYLANDMQFYVISPLILLPLFWNRIAGTAIVAVYILVTLIVVGVLSSIHHITPSLGELKNSQNAEDNNEIYTKPYARIGPYLVGMMVGYVLYITECKPKLNRMMALIGWLVATATALALLYGLYDANKPKGHPLDKNVAALYKSVSRTVWGACVGWVIYACCTGYGGFVNTLMSWRAFVPMSRLTYCAYLIHPIIIFYVYSSSEVLIYAADLSLIYLFLGHMVMTYGCAFVVSMVFEAPMMALEKAILADRRY